MDGPGDLYVIYFKSMDYYNRYVGFEGEVLAIKGLGASEAESRVLRE